MPSSVNTGALCSTWMGKDLRKRTRFVIRASLIRRNGFLNWGYDVTTWVRMGRNHYDHMWALMGVLPDEPDYLDLDPVTKSYSGFWTKNRAERHMLKHYTVREGYDRDAVGYEDVDMVIL